MQHDDDAPNEANGAAYAAQDAQLLAQEITPQHSADENAERAQWCHENGRRERIRREIADFANHHGQNARPPDWVLEICEAIAFEAVGLGCGIQALLRNYKGRTNPDCAGHSERQPDVFILYHDRICADHQRWSGDANAALVLGCSAKLVLDRAGGGAEDVRLFAESDSMRAHDTGPSVTAEAATLLPVAGERSQWTRGWGGRGLRSLQEPDPMDGQLSLWAPGL
nr:hypothetical protein CFP56_54970 [Quercus suber]POF24048.1 hypothetical protein CFP56_54984 [Quercus suber]